MYKIKKRCFRCLHVLRDDGTCQNPKCSRYVAEDDTATGTDTSTSTESSTDTTTSNSTAE